MLAGSGMVVDATSMLWMSWIVLGVQSLVQSRYPGSLYCAVETSGDGATNFYSRVQMFMFKARQAAEEELARTFTECGVTEAEVRRFLAENPRYNSALHVPPEQAPVAE